MGDRERGKRGGRGRGNDSRRSQSKQQQQQPQPTAIAKPIILAKNPSTEGPRQPVRPRALYDPSGSERGSAKPMSTPGTPTATLKPGKGSSAAIPISPPLLRRPKKINDSPASSPGRYGAPRDPEPRKHVGPAPDRVKLLDERLMYSDEASSLLVDDVTSFLVVGVIGGQGVGKSTILSLLHEKKGVFPTQTFQDDMIGMHETLGIDISVTAERVILLDCQPVLSTSVLDKLIRTDAPMPPGTTTYEQSMTMQSYQLALFLLSVCHIVLVVNDVFPDYSMSRFLRSALMLRQLTSFESQGKNSRGNYEAVTPQRCIDLVYVINKAAPDMLSTEAATTAQGFLDDSISLTGSSMTDDNTNNSNMTPNEILIQQSNRNRPITNVSLGVLPEMPDNAPHSNAFTGRPTFTLLANNLKNRVLSTQRYQIVPGSKQPTEIEWLHFASKVWASYGKSSRLLEFNSILQEMKLL